MSDQAPVERPITPRQVETTRKALHKQAGAELLEQVKVHVTRESVLEALSQPAPHCLVMQYNLPSVLNERSDSAVERYLDTLICRGHYKREWSRRNKGEELVLELIPLKPNQEVVKTVEYHIHIVFCLFFCQLAAIFGFAVSQLFGK